MYKNRIERRENRETKREIRKKNGEDLPDRQANVNKLSFFVLPLSLKGVKKSMIFNDFTL